MPNYKNYATNVINIGGFIYPIKANETAKVLHWDGGVTTTGKTFHDETGTDYQVPAGKTFRAIGLVIKSITSGVRTLTVFSATAADSTTGESDKQVIRDTQSAVYEEVPLVHLPEFSATTYVNHKVDNTTSALFPVRLIGVEY